MRIFYNSMRKLGLIFFNRVCQYHINFPRIDLAIDDRKPYLSVPDLIIRTKEGLLSSKLREIDFHDSGELKEDVFQSKGGSLYLGSSASNLRLVFYEKGYEQAEKFGKELNPDWNRYELRFRHKKSGQISRRTSERQGCGTDCVVCIKRESAVFTEAGKQHGYKKTALSYLSPVGRTHAGCREDKVDHESREKDTGTNMAVAERSSFALFKANG